VKINGVTIKTPSSLGWGIADLSSEESARTLDGKSHKDIIAQKVRLECRWANPNAQETSALLKAVVPYAYVDVTYLCPIDNIEKTKRFYTGDKTAPVRSYAFGDAQYSEVAFNFVEE
jgi:hypothetical protein